MEHLYCEDCGRPIPDKPKYRKLGLCPRCHNVRARFADLKPGMWQWVKEVVAYQIQRELGNFKSEYQPQRPPDRRLPLTKQQNGD